MLRLFGILVTLSIVAGAVLMLDFNTVRKEAAAAEQPVPDFQTYLNGLQPRVLGLLSKSGGSEGLSLTSDISKMLPLAPEGWTVRTVARDDITSIMPKADGVLDANAAALLTSLAVPTGPRGTSAAALTYEKGDSKVIFKAVRYPDTTFADPAALAELKKDKSPFRQNAFLRVRGLDVTESTLPNGMRGRLFSTDIGGQIRVWVLVSRRMTDADVLPFFETLDVRAMNANVIDKEDGLGDIPVMLLASDLDEAGLAAYDADRATRSAEREARRAKVTAAIAETAPPASGEPASKPKDMNCTTSIGGIKRCTVDG